MVTLLKSGIEAILRVFYENKTSKFHLRELCRRTGMHEPSVSRFLKELVNLQVLNFEFEGNLKKYFSLRNKQVYSAFEQFDNERLEKLPSIRRRALKIFIEQLPEKPVFIILFGSTAKGNFRRDSDIDLLVITNNIIQTKKAEEDAYAQTLIEISSFQMIFPEFFREIKLKEDKVLQSALFSGYPIFNNGYFYEMYYNERI